MCRRQPGIRNFEFVIIAIKKDHISWLEEKYKISELRNLTIIPYFCSAEDLHYHFNAARVFVQASITEGMPNTLGEAMLCECIPVGSNVNGIPDLMGNNGVIVQKRSVDELEAAIYKAMELDTGKSAREHVIKNFSLEQREKKLIEIIQNC